MKIALVTGTTGGIGGAFAKVLLENGYIVYAPVRDIAKVERLFHGEKNIIAEKLNLSDFSEVKDYFQKRKNEGIFFDVVFLSAGLVGFDSAYSREQLMEANFTTKETVVTGMLEVYGKLVKGVTLVIISSQAANFTIDDPRRVNEEGYVLAQFAVSSLARRLMEQDEFGKVILEEPALVDTVTAKSVFTKEIVGEAEFKSRHLYADEILEKIMKN